MNDDDIKIPGYLPVAILYFFFNSIFLPEGLLYTGILTPVFLWWLYRQQALKAVMYFFLFTIPFIPIHLYNGVDGMYYLRSYLLLFSSVVFGISFYVFLKGSPDVESIFRKILGLNFIFMFIALVALLIPGLKEMLWYLKEFSPGIGTLPRLKMLTYEASYYSLLFMPIAFYYYLRLALLQNKRPFLLFLMATLPLLLSLSLGVIGALFLTFIFLLCYNARLFLRQKVVARFILCCALLVVAGLFFAFRYYPGNPLFGRISNIFSGQDTSFRGRTYESFVLAWRIAKGKSVLFGCGPGQPKIAGIQAFKTYYGYLPPVVRIPNTLGDTLATYGIAGVLLRLFFTVYLFFKTKVYRNYYRLGLFVFMFIYQFTGSFITNIAEYVIWILAFSPVCREFDRDVIAAGKKTVLLTIKDNN